jgi:hypothetical protein
MKDILRYIASTATKATELQYYQYLGYLSINNNVYVHFCPVSINICQAKRTKGLPLCTP